MMLGEFLIEKGYLEKQHINASLKLQEYYKSNGIYKKLGEILIELRLITSYILEHCLLLLGAISGPEITEI